MGGNVSRVLKEMVTLVVANDLASDKCNLALKLAADQTQVCLQEHGVHDMLLPVHDRPVLVTLPWR